LSAKRLPQTGHMRVRRRAPLKRSTKTSPGAEPHDEILVEELNAVHSELSRVDNKSSMLLGFAAGGLLLATTGQPQGIGGWLFKAGVGFAAASIIPLLAVVRPRLGSTGFPYHARRTVAEIESELANVNPRRWRSEQLIALSRIAVRKFKLLRVAAGLQTIALVLASVGTLLVLV
jgi:pycsar effector protein